MSSDPTTNNDIVRINDSLKNLFEDWTTFKQTWVEKGIIDTSNDDFVHFNNMITNGLWTKYYNIILIRRVKYSQCATKMYLSQKNILVIYDYAFDVNINDIICSPAFLLEDIIESITKCLCQLNGKIKCITENTYNRGGSDVEEEKDDEEKDEEAMGSIGGGSSSRLVVD